MFLKKCPNCDGELDQLITWDIVEELYCPNCNFRKRLGTAQFYNGTSYLEPCADDDCDFNDDLILYQTLYGNLKNENEIKNEVENQSLDHENDMPF